jgi:hypothetical protein
LLPEPHVLVDWTRSPRVTNEQAARFYLAGYAGERVFDPTSSREHSEPDFENALKEFEHDRTRVDRVLPDLYDFLKGRWAEVAQVARSLMEARYPGCIRRSLV